MPCPLKGCTHKGKDPVEVLLPPLAFPSKASCFSVMPWPPPMLPWLWCPSASGCFHLATPSHLPGTDPQNLSAQPMPESQAVVCGALVQVICAVLSLLFSPWTSCCPFLQGFEAPPLSQLISPVRWPPRRLISFLFPPSLKRWFHPDSFFPLSFFYFCSNQLCEFSCPFWKIETSANV